MGEGANSWGWKCEGGGSEGPVKKEAEEPDCPSTVVDITEELLEEDDRE